MFLGVSLFLYLPGFKSITLSSWSYTRIAQKASKALIDDVLILELKAVEKVPLIHKAQLLSYMKLLNRPVDLLINFHELVLKDGIHRMVLKNGDSA
jgi:GxxExxY protein